MKCFITYLLLQLSVVCFSQTNIDSLVNQLNKLPSTINSVNTIIDQASKIRSSGLEDAISLYELAELKATRLNNDTLVCNIYLQLAFAYTDATKYKEASEYVIKARKIAEPIKDTTRIIDVHFCLGMLSMKSKEFNNALKEFEIALSHCNTITHLQQKAKLLEAIAGTMSEQNTEGNPDIDKKAIAYSLQAFNISKQINFTHQLINSGCNLGLSYSYIGKLDSSEYYLNYVKPYIKDDNFGQLIFYYNSYGWILQSKKEYKKAIDMYQKAHEYGVKFNSTKWIYEPLESISLVYEEMGDIKNALIFHKKYSSIKDSAVKAANFIAAADLQNKYEREKKDKEITILEKSNLIATEKKKQLTKLLIVTVFGIAFLSAFTFILLKNIRARKKAYTQLENKGQQIKEQAFELSRQAKLIAKFQSQMNPHFTFNALHNIYGLVVTNENEKAEQQIQALANLMRTTLVNSTEEEITLQKEIEYLQNYIDFEKATAPVPINFTIEVDKVLEDAVIPPMMIQPFIENAIKHAALHKVQHPFIKVMIEKENDLMKLIIKDNGKGIEKAEVLGEKLSHSMSIIKSRVELLMQRHNIPFSSKLFDINSTSTGTEISFYLPLNFTY